MWEALGAGAFGFVLGWNLYFVNRYRVDQVVLANLTSVVGVLGGAAVLTLFPAGTRLFAAYSFGLALGFFAYLATLVVMVSRSDRFGVEWFLDGRRPILGPREYLPKTARETGAAMSGDDQALPS